MEPPDIQFVGPPCGHHGSYTFYRAFKFTKGHKTKVITLGQFFFAKITPDAPVCIGDLQLVWHHKNHDDQPLCSVRLYFLPEDTPDGRLACHGEDEILSESEKVVLTIEDLVSWMCEVQWSRGLQAICEKDVKGPSEDHAQLAKMFAANNCGLCESAKDTDQDTTLPEGDDKAQCAVVVLSFPHYCRYRAVRKRLETCVDVWMRNIVISAVGGFTVSNPDTRILFCRNTVEHPSLANHASRQNHLAPNLKGRPRKRKLHFKKTGACDSDTNDSEEGYDPDRQEEDTDRKVPKTSLSSSSDHQPSIKNTSHAHKPSHSQKRKCKFALRPSHKEHLEPEEDTFLKNLYQFMQDRNTPISRLPTLGFKELDLYFFYNYTHKLGGYEAITQKRMWKHIYDTLGGHPSNTSAATCTRRHYERLLLPFERHLCGEEDKPLPMPYVKPRKPVAGATGEVKETGLEDSQPTGKTGSDKTNAKVTCQNVKVTCQLTLAEKERQWEAMRRKGHPNKDKTAKVTGDNPTKVTGDNPTKVTCHNVKVAKKLTDKEKEWEVVRRKSGVNKDKVVNMRKTVKMELELLEQATAKPVKTSEDTKTSAENTPSNVALSRVSDPPVCDTEPVSLVVPSVTQASGTVTQTEGAVIAPSPVAMTVQQKAGPCEIAIPKVLVGGPMSPFMSQSPVVYVRTKPGDASVVAMVTSHDNVRVIPSFDRGKHAVLPSNVSDASPSSRPSVIQQTLTPSVPPGDSFRNKSVLNPAPVAVYGPPSRIVPANHLHSTFTNGVHTTHTSVTTCSTHMYLPPKLGSDVTPLTREHPSRYVPRPQFIPEPLVMGALQPPGYSPGGGDDQPKDLSMKTMRRLQADRPQHPVRAQDHAPDTGVEDGPINLVITRPTLHSPGAPVSAHWGGVSSGGVVWNARLQTTACEAQRYMDSVTGGSHILEAQRGLQPQSPQPTTLGTTPCVHPAFPQPPGTSLSNTPVPLFYKGSPQQPPPSRAYGRPPTLLTPYGGPVMPDLASAMYSRPRGPFMVPVGIPLVNQTAAHSKGKAKY